MVKQLGLELKGLDTLHLRRWGGAKVGYLGYTECTLEIPTVMDFKEDVLLLVVNDTEYGARIPILLETLHIDMVLEKATLEELNNLPAAWRTGTVGSMVLMRQGQLGQNSGTKRKASKEFNYSCNANKENIRCGQYLKAHKENKCFHQGCAR